MGATTDGEEMNSGSTEAERIKPTEKTCEFEENNLSLPQDRNCDIGIQDQKWADGSGIQPSFKMYNMPQRPTSNALNTDHKKAEEQHKNARGSALSAISQRPHSDTVGNILEHVQTTWGTPNTDTPFDLEKSVSPPTSAEIMRLLDIIGNDEWDAMYETLQEEMSLAESDMTKQDPPINPDIDLMDEEGYTPLYKAALKGHLESVDNLISQRANPNKPSKGGLTPLHAAAREGHEDIVDYLILQGADVNVECERGRTPLHTAAEKGHKNIMDSLLAEGADVGKEDKTGWTPFNAAIENNHLEAVKYIIAKGAKQNKFEGKTPFVTAVQFGHLDLVEFFISEGAGVNEDQDKGMIPLQKDNDGISLHVAARSGCMDTIECFILLGADVNEKDDRGSTPLHAAIQNGHVEVASYLKTKGAQDTRVHGMTQLYVAAQSGHLDMVKYLISQGADQNEENDSGQVPLHAAASRGHLDVTSFLLDHGADVNKASMSGWTPYHAAITNGHVNVVEYLTNNGAQDTRFDEMTSLYIAARAGHLNVVKFLISQGHDMNEPNRSGLTPFHGAAMRNRFEVMEYLIRHEVDTAIGEGWIQSRATGRNFQRYTAESISTESTEKVKFNPVKTPFDIAVECGRLDLVTGCNSERKRVNKKNSKGELPLHAAVRSGYIESTIFLILLGADVNKTDDRGTTPLLAAIQNGHVEVVKYLKTKGAQDTRVHGMTQLYVAAQSGHLDVVKFLISQGAEVNEENDSGQVSLHGAASRGHLEVMKFLVYHGADVNKETKSGWTAFHAAISNGHLDVVKYLMNKGAHDSRFEGMKPLYIAARAGHLDVVKLLISKGHDVNEPNGSGHTPFQGAAVRNHFQVLEYFIRHEAYTAIGKGWIPSHAHGRSCQPNITECMSTESIESVKLNREKTPFDTAVECGRLDLVTGCISEKTQVNEKNSAGELPLHAAVRSGCIEIVIFLILLGADVNKRDDRGTTPLLAAIQNGHVEVVKYLKTKGAKDTRVHGMTQLYVAAQSGHLDVVKFLISQGAEVNEENDSGQFPLHGAASRGRLEVMKFLVYHGADVNKETKSGWTAFHAAISNGHLDVVEYWSRNGACQTRFLEMSPLYIAARAGHLKVVKFLISKGHDVNEPNGSGHTPFHGAALRCRYEVMEYLIHQGEYIRTGEAEDDECYKTAVSSSQPEVVENVYTEGIEKKEKTPLYIAVRCGHFEVVKNLIEEGAHVNGTNSNGEIPIHAAARNGSLDITKYLIRQGANLNKKDDVGTTPFLVAVYSGHLEIVKYMKAKGVHDSRVQGMTPLYIAAQSGHLDIVKFLISQGADVNEENDSGQVPLHGAASKGHLEVAKYLVKHEAHVNKETVTGSTPFFHAVSNGHLEVVKYLRTMGACMMRCLGMTPLYIAAQNGHTEVVKFIIREGVDVNDGSISGRTPLHAASFTGNLDVVSCLVREKATVNAKDGDDWTSLHAAAQEGHWDVAIYLIKNGADINATDAEGLTPRLPPSNLGYPHEYPNLCGDDTFGKDLQKTLRSRSYQENGCNTKSFETGRSGNIKDDADQLQLPTTLHHDDIAAQRSPNMPPNEDPVTKENGYTAAEKTDTLSSNCKTPPDTKEKIKGERNPFACARPKCPVDKAPKSVSLEIEYSCYVHPQFDTKPESIVLQQGPYKWQHHREPIVHTTERMANQDLIESGRGTQREENGEMNEVPSLIEFHLAGQPIEDKPAAYTSRSRTQPFLNQNSVEDYAPITETISANSAQDAKKKSRTTGAQCSQWLALLPSFIQMVVVMAFILTGSPVLVAGGPSTEQVILQAGQSAVIPFDIPRFPDNISQFFPHYMLSFESKLRPFCINGESDIKGFKSPSQFPRFTTSVAEKSSSFCVKVNIDPVDILDEDMYVLQAFFYGFDNVKQETVRKEIMVKIPSGPAKCFLTLSENNSYPYEVDCQATTGSMETKLTCYQYGQRFEVKGDVTDNGLVTRGKFLLPDQSPFSCCSHDVTSEVNVTMCNDFVWPPSNNHISPPTVSDTSLAPSVANTVAKIGNNEQESNTLVESQEDSGNCKPYTVSSVSLAIGLMIYLFLFY